LKPREESFPTEDNTNENLERRRRGIGGNKEEFY
jgi:hypothetical protein